MTFDHFRLKHTILLPRQHFGKSKIKPGFIWSHTSPMVHAGKANIFRTLSMSPSLANQSTYFFSGTVCCSCGGGGLILAGEDFGRMIDHSFLACIFLFFSFLSGDQLTRTNSTLYARISPQWLSKLR